MEERGCGGGEETEGGRLLLLSLGAAVTDFGGRFLPTNISPPSISRRRHTQQSIVYIVFQDGY